MARIPFVGRLNITEYVAVVGSFFLVGLEAIVRVLTLALPSSILVLFYRASRRLFNRYTSPSSKKAEDRKQTITAGLRDASDFVDLCALFGYYAEEHVVQTKDGYLLGLHRLGWRKGEEEEKVNSGPGSIRKRVVYLHHGLMMNSEVWVCLTEAERCLPFMLVEHGYDVWLGNNRGNKYSKKSVHHGPSSIPFWNFSMDEFAFYDIPDSIDYVLSTTAAPSLSYIGFSQGTAQAFATLSIHPTLNAKVDVFVALAPAMSPAGLSNGVVDALIKSSPQILFLLFGRRSILSSTTFWQSILYPPIFVRVIDTGLSFLFGWHAKNMSASQKLAAYPHLFSFTSTKSVVHWFQIIRNKSFQMYDDDVQRPLSIGSVSKYTKVAKFPTRNIKTPIVLVYGGSDSLVDINVMLKELPPHTVATEIPHYEHLDFLWGRDVDTLVFPHVLDALESFATAEHSKEEYAKFRAARHASIGAAKNGERQGLPRYVSEDESTKSPDVSSYADVAAVTPTMPVKNSAIVSSAPRANMSSSIPSPGGKKRVRLSEDASMTTSPHVRLVKAVEGPNDTDGANELTRRGSFGSTLSVDSGKAPSFAPSLVSSFKSSSGGRGFNIGMGRVASGVVSQGQGVGRLETGLASGSESEKSKKGGRKVKD